MINSNYNKMKYTSSISKPIIGAEIAFEISSAISICSRILSIVSSTLFISLNIKKIGYYFK